MTSRSWWTTPDGERASYTLPYRSDEDLEWARLSEPTLSRVPARAADTRRSTCIRSDDGRPMVGDDLVRVPGDHGRRRRRLGSLCVAENDLLGHALVVDGTRSRGGSRGPYAVQRMTSKPFTTTFGNLRLSDVTPLFIAEKNDEFERNFSAGRHCA